MGKLVDIAGQKFNRLTAVAHVAYNRWKFRCDCGTEFEALAANVKAGSTTSCGCYAREATIARSTTHGHSKHELFGTYTQMIARCTDPNHTRYVSYGGRGIKVCDRWLESFENFVADMGERPEGMTLDRYPNNDGDYEPGNCRWATDGEQARNRSDNVRVTINGVTKTVRDWEISRGVKAGAFQRRIDLGWPPGRAVSESIQPGKPLRTRT